jgi:hypothetical protein
MIPQQGGAIVPEGAISQSEIDTLEGKYQLRGQERTETL